MAVAPQVSGSAVVEFFRAGSPFSIRVSTRSYGVSSTPSATRGNSGQLEGPSCVFVGKIETASQETLEALYCQARDAYYSGEPLIVDDMFDRVELKLRWYGSKYAIKYPRCSLRRQSTYADAEEDPSQVFALASVWLLFLGFGSIACLVPIMYIVAQVYQDAFDSGISPNDQASAVEFLAPLNGIFFILGFITGYPIASASGTFNLKLYYVLAYYFAKAMNCFSSNIWSRKPIILSRLQNVHTKEVFEGCDILSNPDFLIVGALQGLWKNDLVALKGACPNCTEEVFAFVRSDQPNQSSHRAECHVCESSLEFQTKVEQSISRPGTRWVHGRIYLIRPKSRY